MDIADSVNRVEHRIAMACDRAGRDRADVTLVAVSKTRTAEQIDAAARAGITDVGENRVQEAATKRPEVTLPLRWHLIGHLQTNKVRRALELFSTVQSVDSVRLGEELQRRCEEAGTTVTVMAEVNTSGEATKFGVSPEELPLLTREISRLDRLELAGLMTIGPGWAVEDPEASRPCFEKLARLAERARQDLGIPLPHLSMGMTSDFEVGIEEGATMVRIGTAIFGARV